MEKTNLRLEDEWPRVKEKLLEIKPELSEDDLQLQAGQEQQLFERLAQKMNRSADEIRMWIESVSFNKDQAG